MITPDKSWDLSGTLQMLNSNNETYNQKLTGRFDPNTATAEKIFTLATALTSLTRNSYVDTKLTAQKSLADLIDGDDDDD